MISTLREWFRTFVAAVVGITGFIAWRLIADTLGVNQRTEWGAAATLTIVGNFFAIAWLIHARATGHSDERFSSMQMRREIITQGRTDYSTWPPGSSAGFDVLRRRHPHDHALLRLVETFFRGIATDHVVDERSLEQFAKLSTERAERLLVELVQVGVLKTHFVWICPLNGGSAWNGDHLPDAPSWISCPACWESHFFSQRDIDVHLLLRDDLRRGVPQT